MMNDQGNGHGHSGSTGRGGTVPFVYHLSFGIGSSAAPFAAEEVRDG